MELDTGVPRPEIPPGERVAAVVALVRALVTVVVIVVGYFVLPLDRFGSLNPAVTIPVFLVAFGLFVAFQVVAIMRSRTPGIRAVEALGASVALLLVLFAATYYVMGLDDTAAFTEPLDRLDALYFTTTVFATVGFGDIAPVSRGARATSVVQMVANLVTIGVGVRVIMGAAKAARGR